MKINKNNLPYILLFISIAAFMLIAAKGITMPQPGDENVYYYMGKLVSEGKIPYRDFFYAHPPLHIYLISLAYSLFGFNILILKSIPLICTLTTAIFVFLIAKNKYGAYEALVASLLYLFSYSIMFNSVFSFGIELAVMFLAAGMFFLWNKNSPLMAGFFFGMAGITRLLAIMPVAIISAATFLQDKKKSWKLLCGFSIVFLSANLIFASLSGDYLTQAYKFHLLKSPQAGENAKEYIGMIKLNWILFASIIPLFFLKEKKRAGIFAVISSAYLIFLMALKNIFGFYFMVAFPFLAIAGGFGIVSAIRGISGKKRLAAAISALLALAFSWNLASDVLFIEKIGFSGFERGKDLSDYISLKYSKGTMLFGDESVVPLLALMTGRKVALDSVDTNNQIFISGIKNLRETFNLLKGKGVLFIIRSRQGISYFAETREFLNTNCELLSSFHDKAEGDYLVYGCA